ncbi:MAG: hypothetical protein J5793_05730 [Clostridia bacterium]|nr:hypothetical protein [Clostridia bacterium]
MSTAVIDNGILSAVTIGFGATLKSLKFQGVELVAGYPDPALYATGDCYFGATVGRTCNRTGKKNFIDGREYELELNERGVNHLHGGVTGFGKREWELSGCGKDFAEYFRVSPDGEDGYPGNLQVGSGYYLQGNALVIRHTAVTDAPTWVSMTNHSYFNLNGAGSGSVFGMKFSIDADDVSLYDPDARVIGRVAAKDRLGFAPGDVNVLKAALDDNFYLKRSFGSKEFAGKTVFLSAVTEGERFRMKTFTDLPCLQFYTGGFIPDGTPLNGGKTVSRYGAFCLESQFEPGFQSRGENILRPGGIYEHTTVYEFETI